MFNNGLKKEALNALKKEKSIYDIQLTKTIEVLEEFHNNKLDVKASINEFYEKLRKVGGKPQDIEFDLHDIKEELNKFDDEVKKIQNEAENRGNMVRRRGC